MLLFVLKKEIGVTENIEKSKESLTKTSPEQFDLFNPPPGQGNSFNENSKEHHSMRTLLLIQREASIPLNIFNFGSNLKEAQRD